MRNRSIPHLISEQMPLLLPMKRTPGVHISVCLSRICTRKGHFTPSVGPIELARAELGLAWEHGLKQRLRENYKDRYEDLGEIERDGIYGTPDFIDCDPTQDRDIELLVKEKNLRIKGGKIVEEDKCTWMRSTHSPQGIDYWKYWVQIMSYCFMLGLNTGSLRIVFVNGDYSHRTGSPVKYKYILRQFTQWEIISNWSRILSESRAMECEARERGFDSVKQEMMAKEGNGDANR